MMNGRIVTDVSELAWKYQISSLKSNEAQKETSEFNLGEVLLTTSALILLQLTGTPKINGSKSNINESVLR